jgi:nucleoid-associated protein YgaU|tara:strand:- start:213 stop:491 length:279 start_codon:yes stop_codon:yes gene_type:complete
MKKVIDAIKAINPNAEVVIRGDSVDDCEIQWLEKTSEISKADIKAKMASMEYIYKRQDEYPSLKDQLDDLYHNGIDGWKKTIKAVKDKYPKG